MDRHSTPVQGCYTISINIENPHDLNDTDVPTEESRIESETENTKKMSNERAEEQRSESNDNEHEIHQLDPTSRVATIATTEEPKNEQRNQLLRKINTVCNFCKKKVLSTRHDR